MKKALLLITILSLLCVNTYALDFPKSWWPSFGYDSQKNAVSPWGYAPPIIEDKYWNVQLKTGIWSQPVASENKLYVLSVVDSAKNEKSSIHVLDLKVNFGKELRKIDVSIVESANIQKYDDSPVATPAIALSENDETLLVFGDNRGKISIYNNEKLVSENNLGNSFPFPIGTSPTIHDGKILISNSNKRCFIVDMSKPLDNHPGIQTKQNVSSCISVWKNFAMAGDNSGYFNIFDINSRNNVDDIKINGIDTIRSSACIANDNGKTYAVFGSNKGGLHRIRLDDKSFETQSVFVTRGQGRDEFWATPTYYDGYVYIGNENNFLYKVKLDTMEVVNRINLNNSIFSQAVVNNGFLYVNTANRINNSEEFTGSLYIIKLDDFKVFGREYKIDGGAYSSPIFAANRLFVASRSGKVYCFKGMEPSLSITPTDSVSFLSVPYDTKTIAPKTLKITNTTNYTKITGAIRVDKENKWLSTSVSNIEGNETTFNVNVDMEKVPIDSRELTGKIYIDYIFGLQNYTKEIPVRITFETKPPDFKVDKSAIKIKLISDEKIESVRAYLTENNVDGEFTFVAKSSDNQDWFEIVNPTFTLSKSKSSEIVTIRVLKEKLQSKYPGVFKFSGTLEVSCIYRNKPTDTKFVSLSLELEKEFLLPVPVLDNNKYTKTIKYLDYVNGFEDEPTFVIENRAKIGVIKIIKQPTIDYTSSPIKNWISFSQSFPLEQDGEFKIALKASIKSKEFAPNKSYTAKINVDFATSEPINIFITCNTLTADKITVKFVIGSTSYWVEEQNKKMTTPPFISSKGNTMVPIKPIAETLGFYYDAKINWYADIKTVTLEMGEKTLRLVIGHNKAYIDNPDGSISEMILSSPPEIKNGYTFIPPKVITDTFGGKSTWDSKTKTVKFEFVNPRKSQ